MTFPRVTFLVNGTSQSIEAVRARGLARRLPPDRIRFLFRDSSRLASWRNWSVALRRKQPDLLYVLNTAMPGAALAVWWRHRYGTPYLLDTGDAVHAMARQSGIQGGWRLPLLWLLEKSAQQNASTIVVRGTRHREHLQECGLHNITVIRDGFAEQSVATPESVARLRLKLGLGNRFVVGVMGSLTFSPRLGICYGWDLIRALHRLAPLPIIGLIIGDGNGQSWLKNQARLIGVDGRVIFCGRIPYQEVPVYLRLMDIALSTQTNNLPGQVRTTGKLPEYMAADRFIIASRVGEAAFLLPELMLLDYYGNLDQNYPARLADRVGLLHNRPELMKEGLLLSKIARRECNYDLLSESLMRALHLSPKRLSDVL